jgi:putative Mg2+ transporter-C (MgtC) family protein
MDWLARNGIGQTILTEVSVDTILPWPVIALRLLGAIFLCGLIGVERETRRQPAGLRTHILVGLAACLYAIITLEIVARDHGDLVRMDPLRIVEAVTGGVAFLAAGLIVFHNGQVKGLTTGAGMWLAAAVGLCCGIGLWGVAVMATGLSLTVMIALKLVEDRVIRRDK